MSLKETIANVFAQRDDRAVSPVIGVILMVAITVILAAVIGTMVLGMTDSVGTNAQAGVSFSQNETAVEVQLTSLGNVDSVNVTYSGDASFDETKMDSVGQVVAVGGPDNSVSAGERITIIGTVNGKESTVATYKVK